MQELPHTYIVTAHGGSEGTVPLTSDGLQSLPSAAPAEFDGPGDLWSPETLLVSAAAGCFILSFRAVARASKVPWTSLTCRAEAVLDRVERAMQFTEISLRVDLVVPEEVEEERALRVLEKAERTCLVTNSLSAAVHLIPSVSREAAAA